VLLLLMIVLLKASQEARQTLFRDRSDDFAHNAHLLFARSLLPDSSLDDDDGAAGDVNDFLPGQPRHTPNRLQKSPTNIIVVVLESGGAIYMQNQGYPLPTTPQLCKLREKSLTFDNFYATANHSIASALPIFASTYNDPRTLATVIEHPGFPMPAVSRWLQEQGYQTYVMAGGGNSWENYRNM